MSARLEQLARRKELLLARLQLQRMETTLRAAELRDALRATSLLGGAIARPAALVGLIDTIAPLFGLRRVARWTRLAAVALVALRILRNWRGSPRPASGQDAPHQATSEETSAPAP